MINLDNINKVFMCDRYNSEFEIKCPRTIQNKLFEMQVVTFSTKLLMV